MKIMATSFKRSHACTAALSAPDPAAGHRWPTPLPKTPGHSWASLGQSLVWSLLLSPGSWCSQGFVCALQESISPVLCKFCWLYSNLLQESLCHTLAGLLHPEPLQQATADPYLHRRHSDTLLAQSLWVGHAFCAFPALSSSDDQVLGEHNVPGGPCVLITSPDLATQFPSVLQEHHLWCAVCLLWGVISGCSPPGWYQPSRISGIHG